jgi:hypothetical protein
VDGSEKARASEHSERGVRRSRVLWKPRAIGPSGGSREGYEGAESFGSERVKRAPGPSGGSREGYEGAGETRESERWGGVANEGARSFGPAPSDSLDWSERGTSRVRASEIGPS